MERIHHVLNWLYFASMAYNKVDRMRAATLTLQQMLTLLVQLELHIYLSSIWAHWYSCITTATDQSFLAAHTFLSEPRALWGSLDGSAMKSSRWRYTDNTLRPSEVVSSAIFNWGFFSRHFHESSQSLYFEQFCSYIWDSHISVCFSTYYFFWWAFLKGGG